MVLHVYLCSICDNVYWHHKRKYCSDEYKVEARRRRNAKRRAQIPKKKLTRGGNTWYQYRKFKKSVLEERGEICERCGNPGKILHHLASLSKYPHLELDYRAVQVRCGECHTLEHPELSPDFIKNNWNNL